MGYLRVKYPCNGHIRVGTEKIVNQVSLQREILLKYTPAQNFTIKVNDIEKNIKIRVIDGTSRTNGDEIASSSSSSASSSGLYMVRRIPPKWSLTEAQNSKELYIEPRELRVRRETSLMFDEPQKLRIEDLEVIGFINIQKKIKIEKERKKLRDELDFLWCESTLHGWWFYYYYGEPDIFHLNNLFNENN